MSLEQDQLFLQYALALADKRMGFCAPNPSVGAIVVQQQAIVGWGNHHASGTDHAEVIAIHHAGELTRNATLYVTLEPCCHQGKTPPCTALIVRSGIKRVVYGYMDPNPKISSKGAQQLLDQGVEVAYVPTQAINCFYQAYAYWWRTQKPLVHLKMAMSLDGKIAQDVNTRTHISGQPEMRYTMQQRLRADVLLTTISTVLADNPQFNVRLHEVVTTKPVAVVDRLLTMPLSSRVAESASPLILLHATQAEAKKVEAWRAKGAQCIALEEMNNHIGGEQILNALGAMGYQSVWLECGQKFASAWIKSGYVHRIVLYSSPIWLGSNAYAAFIGTHNVLENYRCVDTFVQGHAAVMSFVEKH